MGPCEAAVRPSPASWKERGSRSPLPSLSFPIWADGLGSWLLPSLIRKREAAPFHESCGWLAEACNVQRWGNLVTMRTWGEAFHSFIFIESLFLFIKVRPFSL